MYYITEPRVELFPLHQTAEVGETVQFTCQSEVSVAWRFDGGPVLQNTFIRRLQAGTETHYILSIQEVTLRNSGTYSCHNEDEHSFNFEKSGVLTVRGEL